MAGITGTRMLAGITVTGLIATGVHTGKEIRLADYIKFSKTKISGTGIKIGGTEIRISGIGITIGTGIEIDGTEIGISRAGITIGNGIEIEEWPMAQALCTDRRRMPRQPATGRSTTDMTCNMTQLWGHILFWA